MLAADYIDEGRQTKDGCSIQQGKLSFHSIDVPTYNVQRRPLNVADIQQAVLMLIFFLTGRFFNKDDFLPRGRI